MNLKQPRFWYKKSKKNYIIKNIFFIFSLIYLVIFYLRKILVKKTRLNKYIITIGNIVVGGSGKTPTAIKIKQILDNNKLSAIFLTRGYKGNFLGPKLISSKSNIRDIGDEAKLLCSHGRVILAKKRHKINDFLKNIKEDYLILDDGLQNPYLIHDIKIIVVDNKYLFGNKYFLPAGPLRSPIISALNNADIIILIGDDHNNEIDNDLIKFANKIFKAKYKKIGSYNKNNKYFAFSALANNNKFIDSLKKEGLKIEKSKFFSDHHYFSNNEINSLIKEAKKENLKLITTSKDFVKIAKKYKEEIIEFKIELEFVEEQKLTKKLLSCLKK